MNLPRLLVLIFPMLVSLCAVQAQTKLSANTLSFLHHRAGSQCMDSSQKHAQCNIKPDVETIGAFISLNDISDVDILRSHGVTVQNVFGRILTAKIVVDSIVPVSLLPSVEQIDVEKNVRANNMKARLMTCTDDVHNGVGLPEGFGGKDVVIGIIDTGIDYNHINFKDIDGNSRVKRVHTPTCDYTTSEEISALTTDYTLESHGTHTAGTAAGSFSGNGYQGMAPQADLVLCGLDSMLTDVNIINSCKFVFDYANAVCKPAVVNMSLACQTGAHDGTSCQCQAFDAMKRDGNIIVLSSSNFGDCKQYISRTFAVADENVPQLQTMLRSKYAGGYAYENACVDIWSRSNKPFRFQIAVVDGENKIIHSSAIFTPDADGFAWDVVEDNSGFSDYYNDFKVTAVGGLNANGKYNVMLEFNCLATSFNGCHAAIILYGKVGETIDMWTDGPTSLVSNNSQEFTDGDDTCSVSDMATGSNTISVGAYRSQSDFPASTASWFKYDKQLEGSIAPFSSYGIDMNGIAHPDVCGPGFAVCSSVNRYDTNLNRQCVVSSVDVEGTTYEWGLNGGTSMSAPAVSGIVALWLGVNPSLSIDDVKQVIQHTSIRDEAVLSGNQVQWGAGKINALAGMVALLNSNVDNVAVKQDAFFIYNDTRNGSFDLYLQNAPESVVVNIYSLNGSLVYSQMSFFSNNEAHIDTGLPQGVYILQTLSTHASHAVRLVVI